MPCASDTIAAGVFPPPIPANAVNTSPEDRPKRHWLFGPRSSHQAKHAEKIKPRDSDACGSTTVASGYPKYNILMIIVDQMRAPRWLPSNNGATGALSGQAAINAILPNIATIRNQSCVFSNYNVAATSCSPSRATLLTGLYSQQTCIFVTQDPPNSNNPFLNQVYPPALQPWKGGQGFPTIGDVLSQTNNPNTGAPALGYDCVWIGKWHLSDNPQEYVDSSCYPGYNGPSDYGFSDQYCIPTPPTLTSGPYVNTGPYPSSTGDPNEGNSGYFLGNLQTGPPPTVPPDLPNFLGNNPPLVGQYGPAPGAAPYGVLNDAAVAEAFGKWIAQVPTSPKWFAAVSFMNPHDINAFPYAFGLTSAPCDQGTPDFCYDGTGVTPAGQYAFDVPPGLYSAQNYESEGAQDPESTTIAPFPSNPPLDGGPLYWVNAEPQNLNTGLYVQYPNFPSGYSPSWNYSDPPTQYSPTTSSGKPELQSQFQLTQNNICGEIRANGWYEFLNYYFWMQACVDVQIGKVLTALQENNFAENTVIIFTADHGEFGGSHELHSKGGALYEEALNVPLYIKFPNQTAAVQRSFVCSSVDILPFLYTLALGNDSWRNNTCDIINYLKGREAIMDAIMAGTQNAPQRRLSSFPLTNPQGTAPWQMYQPYVLHSTDEYYIVAELGIPPHALAFRTFDNTLNCGTASSEQLRDAGPSGGGKLGIYSYWYEETSLTGSPTEPVVGSSTYRQQFEFYNYQPAPNTFGNGDASLAVNLQETGNDYWNSSDSGAIASEYINAYQAASSTYQAELQTIYPAIQPGYAAALALWTNYVTKVGCSG